MSIQIGRIYLPKVGICWGHKGLITYSYRKLYLKMNTDNNMGICESLIYYTNQKQNQDRSRTNPKMHACGHSYQEQTTEYWKHDLKLAAWSQDHSALRLPS